MPKAGIGRAFYCFLIGKQIVFVHAFVKKTQQTANSNLKCDTAKNVIEVHAVDGAGRRVVWREIKREQFLAYVFTGYPHTDVGKNPRRAGRKVEAGSR